MTEELENSLQQAIDNYLSERLRAIDEQLLRLQDEFNGALVRLHEAAASGSLQDSFLSAAIAAHLQAARTQKLSGSTTATHASASVQVASIKRAITEIEVQQSQVNVLNALLRNAAGFAERVALFVIKGDRAIGWRVCEASDPNNVEAISSIALPLTADTSVTVAAESQAASMGAPGIYADDSLVSDQLGGEPQNVAVAPLVVRGKVVAVLYADSSSAEPDAISLDALETLTRVAAMAVDLISVRAVSPAAVAEAEKLEPAPVAESYASVEPAEEPAEPAYVPEVEAQAPEVSAEPVMEEESVEAITETDERIPVEAISAGPEEEVAESATEPVNEPAVESSVEPVSASPQVEPDPAPQSVAPSAAPVFSTQYAAPLGSSRRYGVSEPDLPISVGEEERRLHNDARRFARLLVSEIKLYNEPKVKEGRSKNDIYERLRDDIDRSRQMYEKRVAPPVAAHYDYFHQELVNALAEGDPAKLGISYPGAAAPVS